MIIVKAFLMLFGFRIAKPEKRVKKNAVKFSKALKQSFTDDIESLTGKIEKIHKQ
tara:strand:- start:226 stop:390 length:165 start_codon:yes stop_codon:yes gene_type:complete